MIAKITKWLVLIIFVKIISVLIIARVYTDPRRDVNARENLCRTFNPNVIFIGTSRTLFGIDPALFDSLNHQKTHSYNFGIFSLSPQSSLRIADQILVNNLAVKDIYVELSALDYSTVALKPEYVIQDAIFRANVMADCSNIDSSDKVSSFLRGLNSTLFQMLSIAPQIETAKKIVNPVHDPIEGRAALIDNGHQSVALALSQTNDRLLANKKATQQMLAQVRRSKPNTYYISKINQLIANAASAGKEVIFFYPNNITEAEYLILAQVAPYLPEKNLIRLPSGSMLNEFFKPENLFDPHHLNRKGAAIYTQFLQKESLRLSNL
ncbi:hypothetical protein [Dyadobacter arcticus]|uniref:DUF1574 domain-containing protein n=1 Tax=Dyadobacter arcticus TaxID=1078754 RepID=A0ABX0UHN6_9BACT|nr:hypothetical protein [Dyadobacter arcticus]NIJ51220.1 hypothetical protein [Dyadobacter arcticus]